jgi:hypothetical protein
VLPTEHIADRSAGKQDGVADVLDKCILGEIYWRKSMGRPSTQKLCEAFSLEVWTDEPIARDPLNRSGTTETFHHQRMTKIWDGIDDAEFWRVSFQVAEVDPGHVEITLDIGQDSYDNITYIVPGFKNVSWNGPGPIVETEGSIARPYRVFVPYEITLVKSKVVDHRSIQIVRSRLLPADVKTPFVDDQ